MNHPDLDVLVVVGDPLSNNTAMLARMGELAGIRQVLRVETAEDLEGIEFVCSDRIGITSGASTPTEVTEAVSSYLKEWSRRAGQPIGQEAGR